MKLGLSRNIRNIMKNLNTDHQVEFTVKDLTLWLCNAHALYSEFLHKITLTLESLRETVNM